MTSPDVASGWRTAYHPPADSCDEMLAPGGTARPHWEELLLRLEMRGAAQLDERQEAAQALLREHGVTYNVHADGQSAERRWELDVLPLLIAPREWAQLEAGLIQRTRLLNAVLADFYGPQQLFQAGLLPPALLHANPGFLRPCHGVRPPGGHFLTLHAVDLTRAPNGQWWVLADRTQAPSGVGYTLENRVVLSRVLADDFRASNVERIASFFVQRRAGLRAMAPWTAAPNIVLLTPGPLAETYFEHVYLARYLGFPLVEGNDLTVRDRRVFLKTIDGLQPVDVIIRRVDDTFCDPLELRADSFLGVPGLLEAARAGTVAISNALGAGAVEAPALLAFFPRLARHLLGEALLLPNVATWWCGQAKERAYTLANLHRLVIKRGFVASRVAPVFGESLDRDALAQLTAQIAARPHAFVGQERVPLSTVPVWNGARLEPRPLILRCYICATADGFAVLPGGLTRVSAAPDSPVVSSRDGGGSKDTWVLSDRPVEEVPPLDLRGSVSTTAGMLSVASRVVENVFWLGRYAERLEDTTRLLRVALSRLAGETGPGEAAEFAAIVQCLARLEKLPAHCSDAARFNAISACLSERVFAGDQPGSVRALLDRIALLTARVRDRLSADTWRILNQLLNDFPSAAPTYFNAGAIVGVLHRVVFQLAAFSGMEMENMTRGHAWRFLDMGRRLERASNLIALLRALLAVDPRSAFTLGPLLEYSDSAMTYRRRHLARPELPATLDLLLADRSNPRSLAFQLESLGKHLTKLPGGGSDLPAQRIFTALQRHHAEADFAALGLAALGGNVQLLDDFLAQCASGCWALSDALTQHYFSHVAPIAN